jgi:positive regulator of sigma E activity
MMIPLLGFMTWLLLFDLLQEWPICVTYGAVAGYLFGMAVSLVLTALYKRRVRAKAD